MGLERSLGSNKNKKGGQADSLAAQLSLADPNTYYNLGDYDHILHRFNSPDASPAARARANAAAPNGNGVNNGYAEDSNGVATGSGFGNLAAVVPGGGSSWYKSKGRQAATIANAFKQQQQLGGAYGSSSSSSSTFGGLLSMGSGVKSPGQSLLGGAGAKSPYSPNKSSMFAGSDQQGNPLKSRKRKFRDLVGDSKGTTGTDEVSAPNLAFDFAALQKQILEMDDVENDGFILEDVDDDGEDSSD